jgi:hypothetical protein
MDVTTFGTRSIPATARRLFRGSSDEKRNRRIGRRLAVIVVGVVVATALSPVAPAQATTQWTAAYGEGCNNVGNVGQISTPIPNWSAWIYSSEGNYWGVQGLGGSCDGSMAYARTENVPNDTTIYQWVIPARNGCRNIQIYIPWVHATAWVRYDIWAGRDHWIAWPGSYWNQYYLSGWYSLFPGYVNSQDGYVKVTMRDEEVDGWEVGAGVVSADCS